MGRIRLAVILALAVVAVAACSKDSAAPRKMAEHQMEKALNQGDVKNAKVELGDKKNTDMTGLPETLHYPGAEPIAHVAGADPALKSETYILQTDASVADVSAFFKKALADYAPMSINETPQMVALTYYSKDNKSQVGVVIGSRNASGKTSMNVTLTTR